MIFFFFFKQKTAYEMRISDWSSDVCSSDLDLYDARCRGGRFYASKSDVRERQIDCARLRERAVHMCTQRRDRERGAAAASLWSSRFKGELCLAIALVCVAS